MDGHYSYSDIVAVNFLNLKDPELIVYPNPSNGANINISLTGAGEEILVVLYNTYGQQVYSKLFIQDGKLFLTAIDLSGKLASGIYYVVASSNKEKFNKKLVVKTSY